MNDQAKLVRRAPAAPEVRLGERFEPLVRPWLGERFGVPAAKEADFALDARTLRAAMLRDDPSTEGPES